MVRDFRDTIVERGRRDSKFRRGLLMRGIALIIAGNKEDLQAGRAFMRDYMSARFEVIPGIFKGRA